VILNRRAEVCHLLDLAEHSPSRACVCRRAAAGLDPDRFGPDAQLDLLTLAPANGGDEAAVA
jgi:hypothetical protein